MLFNYIPCSLECGYAANAIRLLWRSVVSSRLADYVLLDPLDAAGGSWLADPPARLGEPGPVVISELGLLADAEWAAVAARLAALAAVRSPHLVRLLEAGRAPEQPAWCSRAWAGARPVAGAPDRHQVLHALAGAARGAHALHEAGVAHGAIRPSAVLVDGAGDGVLDCPVDSQALPPPAVVCARSPGDLDGVEPEALWGEGPSPASDVYALGGAVQTLLTGRPLHPTLLGDQPVTGVQRVLVERPTVDPGLDPPVAELVVACLDPDPAARLESAAALADRLDELGRSGS